MIDQPYRVFGKSSSEPGEGGMIGRRLVKRKSQKLFERDSIINLGFQFRIGIDFKPLLEKKAFHQEERRIGIIAFKAFPSGVVYQKQVFNSGPVNRNIDQFHSLDGPVLFDRVKKREIGEGKTGFHIFKAHDSSRYINLKELYRGNRGLTRNIRNNIKILLHF